MWRNLGNHLNIKLGDGRNQKLPQEIEKIIKTKEYSHLVWLSKRAWDNSKIDFVWNLSHELRHLEQDLKNRSISLAFYFLKYCLKFDMDIEEDRIQMAHIGIGTLIAKCPSHTTLLLPINLDKFIVEILP